MVNKCKICQKPLFALYKNLYDNRHGFPGKFHIYKCENCGFMQTYPQLTPRDLSYIYTNYYPIRDADIENITEASKKIPSQKEIKRNGWETTCHFQTKRGQKVLDVGCGTCQSLLEIKRLGGEAWGVEVDKNSQKVAKKLKLRFHLGTIHNCKFPKKYFDLITASQVLEHEPNPLKFLQECKNFLKPGGKIILSFPNTEALFRKLWGRNWLHWHVPYHLNHFNRKSFELLTKKARLKINSLKTVTPNLWTILQIKSWLNNTKEGQRDIMWDGKSAKINNTTLDLKKQFLRRILPLFDKILVINRLIDTLGMGESFVVELKN